MPFSRKAAAAAFADPASFGTTLLLAVASAYKLEPFREGWLPETLAAEVERDFGVRLSESATSKLMAAATILTTDRFFANLPDFVDLTNALAGAGFDPTVFDPADAAECAWAVAEALFLLDAFLEAGPGEGPPEFAPEIRAYIGKVLDAEGIVDPPDVLRVAEADPDRMGRVLGDFSDDPAAFEAIYAAERDKADAISATVRENLELLLGQLAALLKMPVPEMVEKFGLGGRKALGPGDDPAGLLDD